MAQYDAKEIEKKWRQYWEENKAFEVTEDSSKPKFYGLIEFPYPSGAGLHVGHPRSYTAMDIICRKRRMQGYNVLYPIGFDAFGLPTENYAIKTGRPPAEVTAENIANFTRQLKSLGFSFDWSRAVDTTDPNYYKWTQWIFLQLFKHGLAYKKKQPINWCPKDKIGLANEEVIDGTCERCGSPVEKRDKEQWMLAITKYADSLLKGLDEVDYIDRAKLQQQNWIGRSEGVNYRQRIKDLDIVIEAYDSVPQTFMAQTFAVIAPEHPLLKDLVKDTEYEKPVMEFVEKIKRKKLDKGFDIEKESEGVFTGRYIDNPFGTGDLPIWVASFVVMDYGTGFVNSSACDERDFAFAKKYNIPLHPVMFPADPVLAEQVRNVEVCYHHDPEGILEEPVEFRGRKWGEVREDIIAYIEKKGFGYRKVQYKLRDWVFSRQRYWGEPIPLVFCEDCKNRKYNYVIVHGYNSNSEIGFKPWLKIELEKQGHTVWNPNLPNTNTPNLDEQAEFIVKNAPFSIDENTILVGHSLGGPVVYKVLEKIKTPVAKTVFVDPVASPEFNDNIPRPGLKECSNWEFNWKKIKKHAGRAIILADKNFPVIKESHLQELKTHFDAQYLKIQPSIPHFSCGPENSPVTREPLVLEVCQTTGWVPVPEDQLPLELPKVEKYQPTDTGESPLAAMEDWVKTTCPLCGGPARRETDTMPNWAGSSWYYLAYLMRGISNFQFPISNYKDVFEYWTPVDWYNGGMEHTVLHLLYSRFWNQFLYDIGVVPTREPYAKRTSHGLILAEGGEKMSKSKGNVVNPDEMIEKFSADILRTYIMFMGPFDQPVAWDTNGMIGVKRFLDKVWGLQEKVVVESNVSGQEPRVEALLHQTIKKVTEDIEEMRFNTAVAKMMELSNELSKSDHISSITYHVFIKLLSPFAPHLCEELWSLYGDTGKSIAYESWPMYDESKLVQEVITMVVQVNGKVRASLEVSPDISEEDAKSKALAHEKIQKWLEGKTPRKVVYVKRKLVSIVV